MTGVQTCALPISAQRQREENAPGGGEQLKRGGVAGMQAGSMNSKEAVLHKALDIIHSMIMRGR